MCSNIAKFLTLYSQNMHTDENTLTKNENVNKM